MLFVYSSSGDTEETAQVIQRALTACQHSEEIAAKPVVAGPPQPDPSRIAHVERLADSAERLVQAAEHLIVSYSQDERALELLIEAEAAFEQDDILREAEHQEALAREGFEQSQELAGQAGFGHDPWPPELHETDERLLQPAEEFVSEAERVLDPSWEDVMSRVHNIRARIAQLKTEVSR